MYIELPWRIGVGSGLHKDNNVDGNRLFEQTNCNAMQCNGFPCLAAFLREAINAHRTDVTENPQIDDVILKIFVLHIYLSTAFCKLG